MDGNPIPKPVRVPGFWLGTVEPRVDDVGVLSTLVLDVSRSGAMSGGNLLELGECRRN